jgi:YVTN family beta-propeller protein
VAPPFAAAPARPARNPVALPLGVLTALVALAAVLALVLVNATGGAPAAGAAQPAVLPPPVAYPEPVRPAGTGTQLGRVPVGNGPQDVVVSPDGSRAYTLNYQDVTVIDTASGAATASIGLSGAASAALSPDGSRAYVPLLSGFLSVVDTATNTQIAAVPIPRSPDSATVTADGREVYTVHGEQSGVTFLSVVDIAGNAVVARVPITPPDPTRIAGHIMFAAAAPGSGTVWVGGTTGTISVVDTATRTVVDTFDVEQPESISFRGGRAYVLSGTGGITIYDVATRTKLGHIRQDGVITAIAPSPDGRFLYLATGAYGEPSTIRVLDSATAFLVHEITIDARPAQLAVSPDGRTLFATATQDNVVVVADTTPYT